MGKIKNILTSLWADKGAVFCLVSIVMLLCQFYVFFYLVSMPYGYGVHTMLLIFLADIVVLLFPYILLPGKWRWTMFIPIVLVAIWQLSNVWYARTYMSLMPLRSYFLVENVDSLLVSSILGSIGWVDLLLVLPIVFLALFYVRYKKDILTGRMSKWFRIGYVLISIVLMLLCMLFYSYRRYGLRYDNQENKSFLECCIDCTVERLEERSFHRMDYYMSNGFVAYMFHYLSDFMPQRELSDEEQSEVECFISELPVYNEKVCDNIGKNLIFIVVESLNSWVLDYEIKGKKVAPTLNEIFNDTMAVSARNIVPQVCNGRSSDAHFMYNTGLLPSKDVVTAVDFGDADYPSMAKSLKPYGYSAFEMIGDNARFGNQEITRRSYGFDSLYDIMAHTDGMGTDMLEVDSVVLESAFEKIKNAQTPFYAMVVTLSMHMPYNRLADCPLWLSDEKTIDFETRCYLSAVWNFDKHLAKFIENLKQCGAYDNSVIVIASDHNGYDRNRLGEKSEPEYLDYVVPFAVLNSGIGLNYEYVAGQVDVYPTVLDVMGIVDFEWRGVGRSLLRGPKVMSAVDKNGLIVGVDSSEFVTMQHEAWDISDKIIVSHYFD